MAVFSPLRLGLIAAAALAALGLWLWIGALRSENAALRRDKARLEASIDAYARALQESAMAVTALEASEARIESQEHAARRLREAALAAPAADDAPVAPVLARALEGLAAGEGAP